jgi:hypothetical protein
VSEDEYCEERIARYLELAQAALEAAGRAISPSLQETYVQLSRQWLHLANLAARTIDLSRRISSTLTGDGHDDVHPLSERSRLPPADASHAS